MKTPSIVQSPFLSVVFFLLHLDLGFLTQLLPFVLDFLPDPRPFPESSFLFFSRLLFTFRYSRTPNSVKRFLDQSLNLHRCFELFERFSRWEDGEGAWNGVIGIATFAESCEEGSGDRAGFTRLWGCSSVGCTMVDERESIEQGHISWRKSNDGTWPRMRDRLVQWNKRTARK